MNEISKNSKVQLYVFLGLLFSGLVLVLAILKPLFNVLMLAGILAIIFRPVFLALEKRLKSSFAAAAFTIVFILFAILLFFGIFGGLLYRELAGLYESLRKGDLMVSQAQFIESWPDGLKNYAQNLSMDLNSILAKATGNVFYALSSVLSNLAQFLFNLFIVFFALYYFMKDGSKLKEFILRLSPISGKQEDLIYSKIVSSVNGVMKGTFLVAILQASVGFVGFMIFGLPNPLLWTMATFMSSFIPNVGTAIVVIPAVGYLYVSGQNFQAIGMLIWGLLAIGLIDNLASPKLVGKSAQLHPLLVLLSVIGGLQFFGFLGFLLGPIFMAIFVAILEIYTNGFGEYFEK